jgi:iron only hydrogenase large subunit-like protein
VTGGDGSGDPHWRMNYTPAKPWWISRSERFAALTASRLEAFMDLRKEIRVAVAHGLGNAHTLLDIVRKEPDRFHFIEIMGCPGGCIGGGGQPYASANSIPLDLEALKLRAQALYGNDRSNTIRRSHDNPEIQRLYKDFWSPLSAKSHELLECTISPSARRHRSRI